ncbi:DNA/RNA polymerases superfamily protein [Gossypium australe]|uniref:DNA/RNA polymerases superfamily protein n=1 Tax=Gossypium australe TaxID=47621 RepID=A0A5B6VY37_9ROSI|nr:DNA/RNA polymerases superfamily protein [Gossypium australe]
MSIYCEGTIGLGELTCELVISVEVIDKGIVVTRSFSEILLVDRVYRYVFFTDLVELFFYGFNIILGLDWLIDQKAKIDIELKRLTLRSSEGMEIVVVGERTQFCPTWSRQ